MATTLTNQGGRALKAEESKPVTGLMYDPGTGLQYLPESVLGKQTITNYIWDTNTLAWIKQTAAASGGGGPVTIADGDDTAQGSRADAAWDGIAANATVVSLLKGVFVNTAGGGAAVTIANGADVTTGATADAIVAAGAVGTISAKLRRTTQGLEDLKSLIVLAAGNNNIGDVDIVTVPADPFGVNADAASATGSISAKLRAIAGTGIPITNKHTPQGTVAHDAADADNPIKIGMRAVAGLSGATLVAAADRTDAVADLGGMQLVRDEAPLEDLVDGNASNTDGSSTQVIAAGGAGVKQYLTDVTLTNMSASNIYVEIKSGTTVKWTFPLPANGGVTHSFKKPLKPNAANEAWNFDPSAATTTVYCSMNGFKSKI